MTGVCDCLVKWIGEATAVRVQQQLAQTAIRDNTVETLHITGERELL